MANSVFCQLEASIDPLTHSLTHTNTITHVQTFTALAQLCTIFSWNINSLFIISPDTSWLLRERDCFWKWPLGSCWLIGLEAFFCEGGGWIVWGWRSGSVAGLKLSATFLPAVLDPCLAAAPIISRLDRVAGTWSLSPGLNHSISRAAGEGGDKSPEIFLFSETNISHKQRQLN